MATAQTEQRINWTALLGFTERQVDAMRACYANRYILYGGARGGGKSRWLRWALIELLIDTYSSCGVTGCRAMLACETYPDLRDRQISKIKIEFPTWLGTLSDSKEDGLSFKLAPEFGSGVLCLRNLDDPRKYQSAEFAFIGVDELTKVSRETFDVLRGSLRWPGVEHTAFIGATNPGGMGHLWVKQLWVDRDFPSELRGKADEFIFVRSLPADNPYLPQSYWEELNSLPDDLRRAWVEGDWNVFAGQAFASWRQDKHVVKPFEIPDHWVRVVGIDWGYAAPFVALWVAINPDTGRHYVYREVYQNELTDRQQARTVKLNSGKEHIRQYFADPSMWAKQSAGETITSSADEYKAEGVFIQAADNHRLNGKRKVDRLMADMPDGKPGLMVFENCVNLIRTLPALPYDSTNVEDVDTHAEDHAYDALRYALSELREASTGPKVKGDNPWLKARIF